ncbi:MAG: type II toxin-antitoxin system HicB family antitoxin [Proteobacteria bacterium]|nr:type II toxin-antitoxin system HicB family antitoxin [Pseudomonadota bacterium]
MTTQRYVFPATFSTDDAGRILVVFPDLPGAATDGANVAEAHAEAADCLEEAIAGYIAEGRDIPVPSRRKAGQRLVPVPVQTAAKAALHMALRDAGMSRAALARALGCDVKEVRRILDPRHPTKLPRLAEALTLLGKRLVLEVRDAA